MKSLLEHCHPERGLIVAPKREDQPQSKACPELAEGDLHRLQFIGVPGRSPEN
jgi:hypothetical protein